MKKEKTKKTIDPQNLPNTSELETELKREQYKKAYGSTLRNTIYILITVAASAVLIATLFLPIFRIYGSSMSPTLEEGDIVVSLKTSKYEKGDLIAFYYNNKLLVKRVIATPGEWVDIDLNGNVYVNNQLLNEPYLIDKAYGECNIDLPFQVPEGRVFVMGDHRSVSLDSRVQSIGCISEEMMAGKLALRIWPLNRLHIVQ